MMKKLLASLAISLLFAGDARAQSSTGGGGLSTKAIEALENCFDESDNFTCAPSSGSTLGVINPPGGTADTVPKWSDSTTLTDSNITDDGTDISMPGTVTITEVGNPGIDLTDYGDNSFVDIAITIGDTGIIKWDGLVSDIVIFANGGTDRGSIKFQKTGSSEAAMQYAAFPRAGVVFSVSESRITTLSGTDIDFEVSSGFNLLAASAGTTVLRLISAIGDWDSQHDGSLVVIVCEDSDLTFIDSDLGAEDEINLAGASTDFICSAGDTLTLAPALDFQGGDNLWVEVARSVN